MERSNFNKKVVGFITIGMNIVHVDIVFVFHTCIFIYTYTVLYTCLCVLTSLIIIRFQTPPPTLHGLISLAAFSCCHNNLTLLQATVSEIVKTIGDTGVVLL